MKLFTVIWGQFSRKMYPVSLDLKMIHFYLGKEALVNVFKWDKVIVNLNWEHIL